MIIEPDLIYHWKFEALCSAVGDAKAFRALYRLWAYAQARKQWIFPLDALKVASLCGIREDVEEFWQHMTGRAGWIEHKGGGWYELRGWANINRSMIQAWCTKSKRLPWMDDYDAALAEASATPVVNADAPAVPSGGSCDPGEGGAGGSYDAPYDPPYDLPYDATNREDRGDGIDGIDRIDGTDGIDGIDRMDRQARGAVRKEPPAVSCEAQCTIEQAMAYGPMCQLSPEAAAFWWHTRNAADWHRGTAGGGPSRKVTSWQSDMATSRSWAEAGAAKQREMGKDGRPRKVLRL